MNNNDSYDSIKKVLNQSDIQRCTRILKKLFVEQFWVENIEVFEISDSLIHIHVLDADTNESAMRYYSNFLSIYHRQNILEYTYKDNVIAVHHSIQALLAALTEVSIQNLNDLDLNHAMVSISDLDNSDDSDQDTFSAIDLEDSDQNTFSISDDEEISSLVVCK